MGGVIYPDDTNFKTRKPVMEVLREEHPYLLTPDLSKLDCNSFEDFEEDPEVVTLYISE